MIKLTLFLIFLALAGASADVALDHRDAIGTPATSIYMVPRQKLHVNSWLADFWQPVTEIGGRGRRKAAMPVVFMLCLAAEVW